MHGGSIWPIDYMFDVKKFVRTSKSLYNVKNTSFSDLRKLGDTFAVAGEQVNCFVNCSVVLTFVIFLYFTQRW